jgi:hypothetical protein
MERVLTVWVIIASVSTWDNGPDFPEGFLQDTSSTRVKKMDDKDLPELLGYEERRSPLC